MTDESLVCEHQIQRTWTEPIAGPLIKRYELSRQPQLARESPQEMQKAIASAVSPHNTRSTLPTSTTRKRDRKFWLAFGAVFVSAFLSAVDLTIISPILPSIAQDLGPSKISAAWITSAFLATSAACQPFFGGLADALGRKQAHFAALIIFTVGSVVASAAQTMLQIVAGRAVQGVGGGGIVVVGEVIVSDLTTLAERGYFLGLLSIAFAVAALAAPIAGGWLAMSYSWRAAFYLNFPIGTIAMLMLLQSDLPKPKLSLLEKLQRLDIVGTLLLLASMIALLLGLTNGGISAPWSDTSIIVPLAGGCVLLVAFVVFETLATPLARYPVLPLKLFRHRTSAIAFVLTFLHGVVLYGAIQALVLYFENRGASPLQAAIYILPANAPSTPAAFVAGIIMAATGKYKYQIIASEALMTLGLVLFVTLDTNSTTFKWTMFQMIASFGLGALYSLTLPPIQAALSVSELAQATATFAFCRSFGAVWGVSALLIAFQLQAGRGLVSVPGASAIGLDGSSAIDFVPVVNHLPLEMRDDVRRVFQVAIRVGFMVLVPFAALGLLLAGFVKHVPLPDFNGSQFCLPEPHKVLAVRGQKGPITQSSRALVRCSPSGGMEGAVKAALQPALPSTAASSPPLTDFAPRSMTGIQPNAIATRLRRSDTFENVLDDSYIAQAIV
ncbi:unnamed protein product [Jaminaea pallidilutea]